jgi:ATP-dependent Clp protease ATP-binding subunit ClpB
MENGYDPVYGARPLKRYIQKEITNYIAKEIIAGSVVEGQKIKIDIANGKLSIA